MKLLILLVTFIFVGTANSNSCRKFFIPRKHHLILDNLPVEMDAYQLMKIIRDPRVHSRSKMEVMAIYINDNIDLSNSLTTLVGDNGFPISFFRPVDEARVWRLQNEEQNNYILGFHEIMEVFKELNPKLDLSHGDVSAILSEFDYLARGTNHTVSDLWERDLHPLLTKLAIYDFGVYPRQDTVQNLPLPSLEEAPFNMTIVAWLLASLPNKHQLSELDISRLKIAAYPFFKECNYCNANYSHITRDDFFKLVERYVTNPLPEEPKPNYAQSKEDTW